MEIANERGKIQFIVETQNNSACAWASIAIFELENQHHKATKVAFWYKYRLENVLIMLFSILYCLYLKNQARKMGIWGKKLSWVLVNFFCACYKPLCWRCQNCLQTWNLFFQAQTCPRSNFKWTTKSILRSLKKIDKKHHLTNKHSVSPLITYTHT